MFVTWRAAAVSVLLIPLVGVLGHAYALFGALLVLAVALGVDVALAGKPGDIAVRRGGDTSIRLGENATTTLRLTNRGRRTARIRVRDAWTPSAGATGGVSEFVVPPRQRREARTRLHPTRRGDRQAGPVVVRTLGPLRLAGRQGVQQVPWAVRVLPPFGSRKHLPSRVARLRELDGRSSILQRGQGTEFDSLREYVPGDDVRAIDWRGTARSSTVVVKTWRPERDRHVLIVLDSGRLSAGRVGDQPRLDHAMDAALLLAALAAKAGDRVDLLIADREVRASVRHASPTELLSAMVNAMAPVEPLLAATNFSTLATEILHRVGQRSLIVLVTGLDAATVDEGLVGVLAPILSRHRLVVASITDPGLAELKTGHETPAQVYGAAAVEVDDRRREQTARRLRQLGATVVQAPPEAFAPAVADHYLELKRAGRL